MCKYVSSPIEIMKKGSYKIEFRVLKHFCCSVFPRDHVVEEEEGPCQSLPEACSGREYILARERDDDPSSKNGEGECQCKVIGNGSH